MDNNIYNIIPKGRIYQKKGNRLENAIYKAMPFNIKTSIIKNYIDVDECGNAIIEYDLMYINGDTMISFEIKGINDKLCANNEHRQKILMQAIRQYNYLKSINKNALTVFCFVTGNANMDKTFVNLLESHGILVSVGKFPKNVVNNAINKLRQFITI